MPMSAGALSLGPGFVNSEHHPDTGRMTLRGTAPSFQPTIPMSVI